MIRLALPLLLLVGLSRAQHDCGRSAFDDAAVTGQRIVGGLAARPGEFPWQVSLQTANSFHFCGGSIISDRWVITAAHCISGGGSGRDHQVVVGLHDKRSSAQKHVPDLIIKHRNYNRRTFENDIALIRLPQPLSFSNSIQPVCLPSADQRLAQHQKLVVSGWGSLSSGGSSPNVLQYVSVPVVAHADCDAAYGGDIYEAAMICAGYLGTGGKDSCQGDSGGPLVKGIRDEAFTLYGVVSWGYGCAHPAYPGVYTRVTSYVSWIHDTMAANS